MNKIEIYGISISMCAVLVIPNTLNLYVYGSQEYNETLEYKYATPEEKLKLDSQHIRSDCMVLRDMALFILMLDKCKPIVEEEEKDGGWRVDGIGQTVLNEVNDIKEDLITLIHDTTGINSEPICLTEISGKAKMSAWHVLLKDNDHCQRVIEYYLANGWELVDKYDEKVELIKNQAPSALNSSQLDPR